MRKTTSGSDLHGRESPAFYRDQNVGRDKPSAQRPPDTPSTLPRPIKPAKVTHEWVRIDEVNGQPRIVARHVDDAARVDAVQPVLARRLQHRGADDATTMIRRNCRAADTLLRLASRFGLAPQTVAAMAEDDDLWAVLSRATPGSLIPPEPSDNPLAQPLLAPANKVFACEVVAAMILHGAPQAAGDYLNTFAPGSKKMVVRQLREHPGRPLAALTIEHAAPFKPVLDELDKEFDHVLKTLSDSGCVITPGTERVHVATLHYQGAPDAFPVSELTTFVAEIATTASNVPLLVDVLRQAAGHLRASTSGLPRIAHLLVGLIANAIDTGETLQMLDLLCVLHELHGTEREPSVGRSMQAMLKKAQHERLLLCIHELAKTPVNALDRLAPGWKMALPAFFGPLCAVRPDPALMKAAHDLALTHTAPELQHIVQGVLATVDLESLLRDYHALDGDTQWARLPGLVRKACQTIDSPDAATRLVKEVMHFLRPHERRAHGEAEVACRDALLRELTLKMAALLKDAPRPLSPRWRALATWTWVVEATLALISHRGAGSSSGRLNVLIVGLLRFAPCWRSFAEQSTVLEDTVLLLCQPGPRQMPRGPLGPRGAGQQVTLDLFLLSPAPIQAAVLSLPDAVWARVSHPTRGLNLDEQAHWAQGDRDEVALAMAGAGLVTPDAQAEFLAKRIERPELGPLIEAWRLETLTVSLPRETLNRLPASALDVFPAAALRDNLVLILLWHLQTLPADNAEERRHAAVDLVRRIDLLQGATRFDPAQLRRLGAHLRLGPGKPEAKHQLDQLKLVLRRDTPTLVQLLIGLMQHWLGSSGEASAAQTKTRAELLQTVSTTCKTLMKSLPEEERSRLKKELAAQQARH